MRLMLCKSWRRHPRADAAEEPDTLTMAWSASVRPHLIGSRRRRHHRSSVVGYQPNTANPPLPLEIFGGCSTNEGKLREANAVPGRTLRYPLPSNGQPGRPQSDQGRSRETDAGTCLQSWRGEAQQAMWFAERTRCCLSFPLDPFT